MKKIGTIITIILLLIFSMLVSVRMLLFPISNKTEINKYAKEFNLDPSLVAAIIHFETNFNNEPYKKNKPSGLMKITDETAKKLSEELGIKDFKEDSIKDPDINIKLGSYFISKHFKNNDFKELMADWGERNGKEKDSEKMREYAKQYYAPKIEKRMKIYKILYPELR